MPSKKRKVPAGDGNENAPRKAKALRASKKVKHGKTPTQELTVMQADAARQAVFNTAELLENILLRLPVRSIYSANRVCTQWKALVSTSKAVKEKLFLIPTAPWEILELKPENWPTRAATLDPAPDDAILSELPQSPRYGAPTFLQAVKLHPLLVLFNPSRHSDTDRVKTGSPERVIATLGRKVRMLAASLSKLSEVPTPLTDQSPVLDSAITDPPCKLAKVSQTWLVKDKADGRTENDCVEHTIRSESGITFRDLITSLHQRGKCYLRGNRWSERGPAVSLEEILQYYRENEYDIVRREPRVDIELPSNIVPCDRHWQWMRENRSAKPK